MLGFTCMRPSLHLVSRKMEGERQVYRYKIGGHLENKENVGHRGAKKGFDTILDNH